MTGSAFGASIILFCLGFYTVIVKRNLFKTIIGLSLMEGAVLLFIVASGHIAGGVPPILPAAGSPVNPLPHAFTLTAIVIGASDIALAFAFVIKLHRYFGSVGIDRIRGLKG